MKVFLSIDFEACDGYGKWIAFAVGVFEYYTGTVLHKMIRYIRRPPEEYDTQRQVFWSNNRQAHQWILQHAVDTPANKVEDELCRFVRNMWVLYPRLRVVSDNPSFDIRILDNMLAEREMPLCNMSSRGEWSHVICSYSVQRSLQCAIYPRVKDTFTSHMAHTPWFDVCQKMNQFFCVLDQYPQLVY
jgi:hypothetical protein